jgi:hypothetical protein
MWLQNSVWQSNFQLYRKLWRNPDDQNFKSPRQLIHTLCEVAGKGGIRAIARALSSSGRFS